MSFYRTMLKPSKDCQQYLLQVNQYGEAICYALDGDGKATSFVTGTIRQILDQPIRQATDDLCWIAWRHDNAPYSWGFGYDDPTWQELADRMNGKPSMLRAKALGTYRALQSLGANTEHYIKTKGGKYVLGEMAILWDESEKERAARRDECDGESP